MATLIYDCHGAHDAGEMRNAWVVVRGLGITFGAAEGMAIGDICYFYNVGIYTLPDPLPEYMTLRGENHE